MSIHLGGLHLTPSCSSSLPSVGRRGFARPGKPSQAHPHCPMTSGTRPYTNVSYWRDDRPIQGSILGFASRRYFAHRRRSSISVYSPFLNNSDGTANQKDEVNPILFVTRFVTAILANPDKRGYSVARSRARKRNNDEVFDTRGNSRKSKEKAPVEHDTLGVTSSTLVSPMKTRPIREDGSFH